MAVRRKRNYWEECGPVVGTSAALGFMVGGGMAALVCTLLYQSHLLQKRIQY